MITTIWGGYKMKNVILLFAMMFALTGCTQEVIEKKEVVENEPLEMIDEFVNEGSKYIEGFGTVTIDLAKQYTVYIGQSTFGGMKTNDLLGVNISYQNLEVDMTSVELSFEDESGNEISKGDVWKSYLIPAGTFDIYKDYNLNLQVEQFNPRSKEGSFFYNGLDTPFYVVLTSKNKHIKLLIDLSQSPDKTYTPEDLTVSISDGPITIPDYAEIELLEFTYKEMSYCEIYDGYIRIKIRFNPIKKPVFFTSYLGANWVHTSNHKCDRKYRLLEASEYIDDGQITDEVIGYVEYPVTLLGDYGFKGIFDPIDYIELGFNEKAQGFSRYRVIIDHLDELR
jgi:hypothetical protein